MPTRWPTRRRTQIERPVARRLAGGAMAAAALLLVLGGCGGSTKTVTVTTPPNQGGSSTSTSSGAAHGTSSTGGGAPGTSSSGGATQGTTGGTASGGSQPPATPSEPPTTIVHLGSFVTPTRNIGCMIVSGLARCDIEKRSWSPPPRPSSCPHIVDFGQGIELARTGASRFVCAGDTARDINAPKLPYGSGSELEGLTCVSRSSGVTCTSASSGHGFFISVQGYRLF